MSLRVALSVLVALAAGLVAIYLLAPGPLELAAMKAREGRYSEARADYEELLKERGPVYEIAGPLARLYEDMGDEAAAVALLEAYLKKQAGDVAAARDLARLYGYAQRIDDKIRVLAAIAETHPDPGVLRELAALYNLRGAHWDRANTLIKLAQTDEATFEEFIELAELMAALGDRERALAVSVKAIRSLPEKAALGTLQFHAALALSVGKRELAAEAADVFLAGQQRLDELLALADTFEQGGAPEIALRLVLASRPYGRGDTMARVLAARLGAAGNDKSRAFEALAAMHAKNKLPPEALALLADLGFAAGRDAEVFDILRSLPLASMAISGQTLAIERAELAGRRELLDQWRAEAGKDWSGLPRITAAKLADALGDRARAASLAEQALVEAIDDPDRILAARILAGAGRRERAALVLEEIAKRQRAGGAQPHELRALADAALLLRLNRMALDAARRLTEFSTAPADRALLARALAASGRAKEAWQTITGTDPNSPEVEYATIEVLRALGDRTKLAAYLLERLSQPAVPTARRTDLLAALAEVGGRVRNGSRLVAEIVGELESGALSGEARRVRILALTMLDPEAALPYARALTRSGSVGDVMALANLLRRLGRRDEALEALADAAASARTKAQKKELAYALLDLDGAEAALPLLAELAAKEGGDWRYAYEDALLRLGRRDALAAAMLRRAADPETTDEERRGIAHALLELGRKADAEAIFAALARRAGPQSEDTASLMWLWGPRPGAAHISELAARARTSEPADRAGWLRRILDAGAPREAAELASEFLAKDGDPQMLAIAVEALAALRDRVAIERLVARRAGAIRDASAAEAIARVAFGAGAYRAASLLYEQAAALDPARREALALAGIAAHYEGALSIARPLLERYVGLGGLSTEAIFALAEIHLGARMFAEARRGFERAIAGADARPDDKSLARLKALALLHLGRHEEASAAFRDLIARAPGDLVLRAEAGSVFLDRDDLARAGQILGSP